MDAEKNKVINMDYTLAGCWALFGMPKAQGKLNFLYTSGFMAEKDQGKTLWVGGEARKLRVGPFPIFLNSCSFLIAVEGTELLLIGVFL